MDKHFQVHLVKKFMITSLLCLQSITCIPTSCQSISSGSRSSATEVSVPDLGAYKITDYLGSGKYNSVYGLQQIPSRPPSVARVSITLEYIPVFVGTRKLYKLREKLLFFLHAHYIGGDSIPFIRDILNTSTFYTANYNHNRSLTELSKLRKEQMREANAFTTKGRVFDVNVPLDVYLIRLSDSLIQNNQWKYSVELSLPCFMQIEIRRRYPGSIDELKPGDLIFSEVLTLFYGYWYDQLKFLTTWGGYHMDATVGNILYERSPSGNISFIWNDFGCPRTWENNESLIYCGWYTHPIEEFLEFCTKMLVLEPQASRDNMLDVIDIIRVLIRSQCKQSPSPLLFYSLIVHEVNRLYTLYFPEFKCLL
jgi:hypothetical protein